MKRLTIVPAGLLCFLLVAGCQPGKVTGGGLLNGSTVATLAVTAEQCNGTARGQFEYVDHETSVKLHGDVLSAVHCFGGACSNLSDVDGNVLGPGCSAFDPTFGNGFNDYQVAGTYRSTNPFVRGDGHFLACVSDNGQGSQSTGPDTAALYVLDGPYTGYQNHGALQGNVQAHKCPGSQP